MTRSRPRRFLVRAGCYLELQEDWLLVLCRCQAHLDSFHAQAGTEESMTSRSGRRMFSILQSTEMHTLACRVLLCIRHDRLGVQQSSPHFLRWGGNSVQSQCQKWHSGGGSLQPIATISTRIGYHTGSRWLRVFALIYHESRPDWRAIVHHRGHRCFVQLTSRLRSKSFAPLECWTAQSSSPHFFCPW